MRAWVFDRPVKKQLTLRLDADVNDWFKTHSPNGGGDQTEVIKALRKFVEQRGRRGAGVQSSTVTVIPQKAEAVKDAVQYITVTQ